jgi:hypothetical protein
MCHPLSAITVLSIDMTSFPELLYHWKLSYLPRFDTSRIKPHKLEIYSRIKPYCRVKHRCKIRESTTILNRYFHALFQQLCFEERSRPPRSYIQTPPPPQPPIFLQYELIESEQKLVMRVSKFKSAVGVLIIWEIFNKMWLFFVVFKNLNEL